MERTEEIKTLYCDCCDSKIVNDGMVYGTTLTPVNHMEISKHHICRECIRSLTVELSKCVDEYTFKECVGNVKKNKSYIDSFQVSLL